MNIRTKLETKNLVLLLTLAFFLLIVADYWQKTWDDSAITLAFSRNLVKYGDMIPSQFSDRVEGYSTFLWMLINSVWFWFGISEEGVFIIAKVSSTVLAVINILLYWKLVKEKVNSAFYQITVLLLYTINLQTVTSATFGMETSLYATLVLSTYFLYKNKNNSRLSYTIFALTSALLILIRHEGVLFLVPFAIDTFLSNPKRFFREPFLYFWGVVFLTYHIWHYSFFGEILTNPMIAKRHEPYQPIFFSLKDILYFYAFPFFRFVAIYPFLVLLAGFCIVRFHDFKGIKSNSRDNHWSLVYGIALTGLFVMLITGHSWNADADRLSYPALAFLFLALIHIADITPTEYLMHNARGLIIAILFIGMIMNTAATYRSFNVNRQFLFTVENFRMTSQTVTLTQNILNVHHITFAGPDMGSLLLYDGDGKRVIDIGLICNKELAKNGYAIMDEYVLKKEHPEIIEIHDNWLALFLNSKLFTQMYYPVQVVTENDKIFIFVRQDMIKKLITQEDSTDTVFISKPNMEPDLVTLLAKYGHYLILDLRNSR